VVVEICSASVTLRAVLTASFHVSGTSDTKSGKSLGLGRPGAAVGQFDGFVGWVGFGAAVAKQGGKGESGYVSAEAGLTVDSVKVGSCEYEELRSKQDNKQPGPHLRPMQRPAKAMSLHSSHAHLKPKLALRLSAGPLRPSATGTASSPCRNTQTAPRPLETNSTGQSRLSVLASS